MTEQFSYISELQNSQGDLSVAYTLPSTRTHCLIQLVDEPDAYFLSSPETSLSNNFSDGRPSLHFQSLSTQPSSTFVPHLSQDDLLPSPRTSASSTSIFSRYFFTLPFWVSPYFAGRFPGSPRFSLFLSRVFVIKFCTAASYKH